MADQPRTLWQRLLAFLGLRPSNPAAAAEAQRHEAETRDQAKQEWNDRRGPPIVGG